MKQLESLNRLITLDLMRGYFLIVIILNHLHYYPSGLEWITGQSYLYASTAEGFFLISGIVLGIVRGAKLLDKPFWFAAKKLFKRSLQLYVASIILVILFTLIGWLFLADAGLKYGVYQPTGDILDMIWKTITLQYTYGWADYLRLYALFIFASPLALWLLRKGLWYIVLLISVGVWFMYPIVPIPSGELSQPLSWQLVFFAGFVIGYHWQEIKAWWLGKSALYRKLIVGSTVSVAALALIINVAIVFGDDWPIVGESLRRWDELLSIYFNKDRLPLPRLLLFGVWFAALYFIVRRYQARIRQLLGWLLIPFGTNSLYVYITQAFLVFFTMLIFDAPSEHWFVNLAISLSLIGLVFVAVKTKFLMKIIPR